MGKVSEVEISGHRYRYVYEDGRTNYNGPVGDTPYLSEEDFLKAIVGHKTAINRSDLSAPMQYLSERELLKGNNILDYGAGRGQDADRLGIDKYDPFAHLIKNPDTDKFDLTHNKWPRKKYDTITNNYVLNVIESEDKIDETIEKIQSLLKDDGLAYITVRRDSDSFEEGYNPKSNTFQSTVVLKDAGSKSGHEVENLVDRKGSYAIFKITKLSKVKIERPNL